MVIKTQAYGYEISWQLVKRDTTAVACSNGHYASYSTVSETCQLEKNVDYELICEDEWGDGWNGGNITFAGLTYCNTFLPNSPNICQSFYTPGCNTRMSIKYIKVQGIIFVYFVTLLRK